MQETIGARLKRLRLERGLSQRELSSKGVTYAYISRIEAGARTPSVKALRMLAAKLGVTVEYLETGREIGEAEQRELKLSDAELELRLGADDARHAETKLRQVHEESVRAGDRVSAARALSALGFSAAQRGPTCGPTSTPPSASHTQRSAQRNGASRSSSSAWSTCRPPRPTTPPFRLGSRPCSATRSATPAIPLAPPPSCGRRCNASAATCVHREELAAPARSSS